ncbi:MAG: alpha/beta hydrolase [Rhodobacteraceae bacterium]|nr:MAG: alpha/beta hydrolase [Paracoccaceae bacterium]
MGWALLVLLILAVAWPFWAEARLAPMDGAARKAAPGQFAALSQGVTHYRWLGPVRGPVAVCVHGLTTPSFVWEGLAEGLARLGFRVLVYDLYGRGYSDRPVGVQDRAFFLRQLDDLLADQGLGDDLTVIGYSMGGAIVTAWAADNPGRVREVVLIAPAGLHAIRLSAQRRAMMWPGIGDWMMRAFYPRMHRSGTEAERALPTSVPGIVDLQQAELTRRGFVPAVLASFRGILSESREADHRAIAAAHVPVLGVFGERDALIPQAAMGNLAAWNRKARVEEIAGAGHGLTYTHTDRIIEALAAFQRDKPE